ncbi:MAG TPA: PEP-CTERM sorting domain-containing protein [Tepidisphaeraceae bacterium]|jgi:hypothetical protein|nr:PEP-CTERM sorting domain-containing protein [Tepidisphaeraceae bacterium]
MHCKSNILATTFVTCAIAAAMTAPTASAAPFYDNDFSGDAVGARPNGFTINFPTPANVGDGSMAGDVGVTVVGTSAIGGGNALRMYDQSGGNGATLVRASTALTTATDSGLFSFNFTAGPNLTANIGNSFLRVALGTTGVDASSSSSTSNFQRISFDSTPVGTSGTFRASNVTSGSLEDTTVGTGFTETANNLVEIVFNRTSTPIVYDKAGAQAVAAGKYDLYLNSTLVANDFVMRAGTTAVGAIGFGTGGSQAGADWIVDNVNVSAVPAAVPEPATLGVLTIASLGLLARRRRTMA